MKMPSLLFLSALLLVSYSSTKGNDWKLRSENPEYLHRAVKAITDVIVHDIFSPPVAARIYTYACIAGYETAIAGSRKYQSLAVQLHQLRQIPAPDAAKEYCYPLAAVHALLTVGKALVISEEKIDHFYLMIMREFKDTGMPEEVFSNSIAFGNKVAAHILQYAAMDNYQKTRSLPKYSISNDIGSWKPTPPAYMKAVEPHWNKLRPFLIDSPQQFKPKPPTPFSTDKNSRFYQDAKDVYDSSLNQQAEQITIANFWDCNPFKMHVNGHVMYATKKISPGGHWININRLACRKVNADFLQSIEAYTCLSLTIADSFISCWDEKYRSKVIRPETYINQYIDEHWVPSIQTPPFPEYTSGHSVISAASSVILTKLFGDNFSFDDSTEVEFNLPVRSFRSFKHAAEEAAISRFYGGIHYLPSIYNGATEGYEIGNFISGKLRTRKF